MLGLLTIDDERLFPWYDWSFIEIYVDDVIVKSDSYDNYLAVPEKAFQKCGFTNLKWINWSMPLEFQLKIS